MEVKTIKDLGWENAGGETYKKIQEAIKACNALGHTRTGRTRGYSGTWHETTCEQCGWQFSTDSGD